MLEHLLKSGLSSKQCFPDDTKDSIYDSFFFVFKKFGCTSPVQNHTSVFRVIKSQTENTVKKQQKKHQNNVFFLKGDFILEFASIFLLLLLILSFLL